MSARTFALLAAALMVAAGPAWSQPADSDEPADPPDRVGRLSRVEGNVQQRSADDQQWAQASANYPVTDGFAVATQDGRAEIEVGSLALRVGANSELDINTLTDNAAVVTVAQGEVNLRLGHLTSAGHIQVVTPRGVVDIVAAGQYHIDAGTSDSPTVVGTFNGKAEIERDAGVMNVVPGQVTLMSGDASTGQQISTAQLAPDDLDNWALARDQQEQHPPAVAGAPPPPLSRDMTGAAELGAYGSWSSDPDYGSVWYPATVPVGWAPYSYGHWAWVSPWGWTWIDDQPWGFAPFHYGRWAYRPRGWCWVPGVAVARPVYAPALVAFIGSPGGHLFIGGGIEGVAWFPLAPREVFVPSYRTSVAYVRNVNATNVNVTNIHITQVNNRVVVNNSASVTNSFANRRFVTAVPNNTFASARPVHQAAVVVPASLTTGSQPVAHAPGVSAPPHATRASTGLSGSASRGPQTQSTNFSRSPNAVHIFPTLPPGRGGAPAPTNASVAPNASQTPDNRRNQHTLPPVPPSRGNAIVNRTPGNAPTTTPNGGPTPSNRAVGTVSPKITPQNGTPSGNNGNRTRDNRARPPLPQGGSPSNPGGAAAVTPHAPPKPGPAVGAGNPPPNGGHTNRQFKSTSVPTNQTPRGNPPSSGGHGAPQGNAVHNPPPPVQNRDANRGQQQVQGRGGQPQSKGGQNTDKNPPKNQNNQ